MKIKPTEYDGAFWIGVDSPFKQKYKGTYSEAFLGKWLLFIPKEKIDEVWSLIFSETEQNQLGVSSKVSTYLGWISRGEKDDYVICVHTKDYRDKEDVFRVRKKLFELGFQAKLEYKTDQATSHKNNEIMYSE